ncbi:hypothetical protein AB0F25_22165 [Streptomyces wedmorensis]|uniref:RNA polymerase factor sigma-54 n=1 Tax=Streptomyces wedmorensis TaxID=43759 RepID=UPI00342E2EAD
MAGGMEFGAAPVMALHASPAMVAFASFLQLPACELEALVAEELAENPALEEDPTAVACPLCGAPLRSPGLCPCLYGTGGMPASPVAAPEPRTEDRTARLLAEVTAALPPSEAAIAAYLVGSLGPRGRLDASVEEVAAALGVTPARVRRALAALRAVTPPGTGARDLGECLLLQLDRWEETHGSRQPVVRSVLTHRLEALTGAEHFAEAAEALGIAVEDVRRVRAFVRSELCPDAALDLAPPPADACAPPDLVIARDPGDPDAYTVVLLEPLRLRLSVSPAYLGCLAAPTAAGGPPRAAERLARDQVGRAREFLTRLDRRWRTLHRIAAYVVEAQRPFLDRGPAALNPLCRREVAAALGLHESTVSRAVAGRVALLPCRRAIPLAGFFGTAAGVHSALRDLVERESRPLSDTELARLLAERGYPVARRTVAKYRAVLGIAQRSRRTARPRAA